jgi:uncharacterized protein (TIGR02246 family)
MDDAAPSANPSVAHMRNWVLSSQHERQDVTMQSDEQEIRELVRTWMEATKAGDSETVLGLMTDDVVFLRPGHPPMMGKLAFATATPPPSNQPSPQFDGTSEIQEIKVLGDWAFMWSKLTVVMTMPGGDPPIKRAGDVLSIFKKENGKWRLARDANMLTKSES